MDYQQSLDYLYAFLDASRSLGRARPDLNVPRTRALLRSLGEPQRTFKSILIAGTKGKGSTAALLESIIRAAGYRTGLWTSPHLHTYRERIQVDRQPISRADLVDQIALLRPLIDRYNPTALGSPTTFEIGLLAALDYFARRRIDLAVLEIGLGGRYDNTNAVDPLVSVISSISYDHMEILGDTLARIAAEKAGILRPGIAAITVAQAPEAREVIVRAAEALGTPLYIVDDRRPTTDDRRPTTDDRRQGMVSIHPPPPIPNPLSSTTWFDPYEVYRGPTATRLQGLFQLENARLATGAALLLRNTGLAIDDAAIAAGLANAEWPGRMEVVPGDPPLVLDGAHNGDSAAKLVQSLHAAYPGRSVVFVFGTSQDKDLPRILAALVPAAAALVVTRSQHPRALADLQALARQVEHYLPPDGRRAVPVIEPQIEQAIDLARRLAGSAGIVCVTGSLFVVAAAREVLGIAPEKD